MNIHPDLFDDDLSSAIGTETLLTHDLMPEGLPASSKEACGTADSILGGGLESAPQLQGVTGEEPSE